MESSALWAMRAKPGIMTTPMVTIKLTSVAPRAAVMATARMRSGKLINTSMLRMIMVSTRPR